MFRTCAVLAVENYKGEYLVEYNQLFERYMFGVQVMLDKDAPGEIDWVVERLAASARERFGLMLPTIHFIRSFDLRDIPQDIVQDDELMILVVVCEAKTSESLRFPVGTNFSWWVSKEQLLAMHKDGKLTQLDNDALSVVLHKTNAIHPRYFIGTDMETLGTERITPKRMLQALSRHRRTQLELVIGLIEYKLWEEAYDLSIDGLKLVIHYPIHPETMKLVRRHYEDAGYEITIKDDPYPSWTIWLK